MCIIIISTKNYDEFCDKMLGLDKKIRFAGIYDAPRVYGKIQEGLTSYLSPFETETSPIRRYIDGRHVSSFSKKLERQFLH